MNEASREDLEFLHAFAGCRLTAAEFGHREHLQVAYVYLTRQSVEEAFGEMERDLQRLLTHLGAPASKFHVTLTRAWLLAVHHFMHQAGATKSFADFMARAGSALLDAAIMETHYTRDRLFSEEARAHFLPPNLQEIPQHADRRAPLSYRSPKTEVRPSPIEGRGLFAIAAIARGEIVAVKGGRILTRAAWLELRPLLGPAEIQIDADLFIGPGCMEEREGSMIFSNHSCEPNLGLRGQIVFVALRNIAAEEELTHDWAMTDDDNDKMPCTCGAASCRGVVTGKDWQLPALQARYGHYFSSYLLEKIRKMGVIHEAK